MKKLFCVLVALMICVLPCLAESAAVANPWTDTDAEGFTQLVGLSLNIPEGAENVVWRVLEAEGLGEVQFTWDGMDYTARVQACAEFTDISGLNYEYWDVEDDCAVGTCEGVCKRVFDEAQTVDVCLWFDVVPGVMYSVSAAAEDLDGFDIEAAAEAIYQPMQGEVG